MLSHLVFCGSAPAAGSFCLGTEIGGLRPCFDDVSRVVFLRGHVDLWRSVHSAWHKGYCSV